MDNLRSRILTVVQVLDTDPKDWVIEESVVKDPPISGVRCRARIIPPSGPYSELLRVACWEPTAEKAAASAWDEFSRKMAVMVRVREDAVTTAKARLRLARAALVEVGILNLPEVPSE